MFKASFTAALTAVAAIVAFSAASPATTSPRPVSGCVNQTLSDGIWGLKVTNAVFGTDPSVAVAAYGVTFTLSNVSKQTQVPDSLGVGLPQVVLKDGTILDVATDSQIAYQDAITYTNFKPGMQVSGTYWFRTSDLTNRATSFLLPVSATNTVYHTPLGYKLANPAFSVDLSCNKSPSPSPSS